MERPLLGELDGAHPTFTEAPEHVDIGRRLVGLLALARSARGQGDLPERPLRVASRDAVGFLVERFAHHAATRRGRARRMRHAEAGPICSVAGTTRWLAVARGWLLPCAPVESR